MTQTELNLSLVFSKNLKIQRLMKNYTQEKLADLAGTNAVTISNYERGATWPSREKLAAIIDALEISPYKLFIDTESELENVKVDFSQQVQLFMDSMDKNVIYGNRRNKKKRAKKKKD